MLTMLTRLRNSVARLEESADLHDSTMGDLTERVTEATNDIRLAARAHADAMDWVAAAAIASYMVFAVYLIARHVREGDR